ncbi:hypothetical protein GQ53DRAFT_120836 [Thozetella sp. PMI_491]|nr:hypothetical protein GQ53DRAFT_120836 [Thozetella sp. PMI_491]
MRPEALCQARSSLSSRRCSFTYYHTMHPQTDETPKAEGPIVPSDAPEPAPMAMARSDTGSIRESESGSETTAAAADFEGPSAVCSSPVTPTASVTPTSSVTPSSSVTVLPSKVTPTASKDGGPPAYPLKARLSRIKSITSNREKEWSIHWYLPFLMAALYLAGLCCALGHHFYYTSRHGNTTSSLEWPVRFGTAMAFITVNCFIGAAQIAYKQCAWVSSPPISSLLLSPALVACASEFLALSLTGFPLLAAYIEAEIA